MEDLLGTGSTGDNTSVSTSSIPTQTSLPAEVKPSRNGMDFLDSGVNDVAAALAKTKEPADTAVDGAAPSTPVVKADTKVDASAAAPNVTAIENKGDDNVQGAAFAETSTTTVTDIAPLTWKPEAAAEWSKVPAIVKAEIARREADMFRGIESYKGRAAIGDDLNKVMAPYQEVMTKYKVDQFEMIGNLVKIHERLSFGTKQEQEDIIARVARDYGVDLAKVGANQAHIDPELQKVIDENARLKAEQAATAQRQSAHQTQQHMDMVADFASKPEHVHFPEVAEEIAALLNAGIAKDLEDAYQRAVRSNPTTWAKEEARIRTEAAEKATKEAAARAAELGKATAANLNTSETGAGRTAGAPMTMEETMAETMADINRRKAG